MPLNLVQAKKAVLINARAGNATMLESPSGYGKSTMAMEAFEAFKAEKAQEKKSVGLGIVFAATQTPPDMIGYQFKGEKTFTLPDGVQTTITVTDPSIPLWMLDVYTGKPANMFDCFFLLIDEYGQGEPDTKRAMAEIFLSGGTAPWYLPPGSVRIGCTNSGTRYGVTKDFLFTLSRRTHIKIAQDVNVLVDHWDKPYKYQGKTWTVSPVWKAWAKSNPQVVFETEPKEDGPWCNPRTMCSADRIYQELSADAKGNLDPDDPLLLEMFQGTIGAPATQSTITYLQYLTQLPSYEDVIDDPSNCPVPVKPDLLMIMAYKLASEVSPDDLGECLTYVDRMPKDMGITFVTSLFRRDYKTIMKTPAIQAWVGKNSARIALIANLANS